MKCVHCSRDAKYKDRKSNHGRCPGCKHPFAFEPYTDKLKVTDGQMQHAIQQVSGNGAVAYTTRHLWYEFNRKWRKGAGMHPLGYGGAVAGFGLGAITAAATSSGLPLAIGIVAGAGALFAGVRMGKKRTNRTAAGSPRLPFDDFLANYYGRWRSVHGPGAREPLPVLSRAPIQLSPAAPPDLTTYSFDRALITDRADVAAMLVANNFHFENNCAVLSADGYPFGIRDTVMTMLHRNPNLQVFALHDASRTGCALPALLRAPAWFPNHQVRIIDLGLRPTHVRQLRLLTLPGQPGPLPVEAHAGMSPDDIRWLEAGNIAELETIRPARLLRSAFQGFARYRESRLDGSADAGSIWFYDSSSDTYASDSFG